MTVTQALVSNGSTDLETMVDSVEDDVFVFPTSFAQQRLWFLDQFEPDSPFYNIPLGLRLNGPLDTAALEYTLNEIVQRHESLRTTFAMMNGQPVQVIVPELSLDLPVVDLQHLPHNRREERATWLANEEARQPFNLSHGPLLRAVLLRLDTTHHIILLTMHHIISDGWSMGVMAGEITALYTAFIHGQPSPLPDLPIQYADFAAWQREWLQGEVLEQQLAYWKAQLGSDVPVLMLPTDRPRPAVQTSNGASTSQKFSAHLLAALTTLSQQEGVTLFMTLLAAFNVLLYRYSGQEDICVGTPIANRTRGELEPLIGFFANTLVLRTSLVNNPTFRTLLQQVREITLGAYAHQDLPFEMLVEAVQPERDMSYSTLFQVMFILQNASNQPAASRERDQETPALTIESVDTDSGTSTFDLTLSVNEEVDGLIVSVEYNTDLFDASTIDRMLAHFEHLLEGCAADPNQPIATLPMMTRNERQQLLVTWNATTANYALDQCIHHLFEARAAQTPDACALVWGTEHLTYAELNQRANQLAHYLRTLDVGPDTFVALCIERSLEIVICVLGVLKAGGAYIPLDPAYPSERLSFMLADAQPALLLTQSQLVDKVAALTTAGTCLVVLESKVAAIAQHPTTNPSHTAAPTNLAYMIYTSGSTGQSKGVMVEHRSLLNAYRAWENAYHLHTTTAHLQMANFAFDVFTGDMVRALCSGSKLVLCPREFLLTPQQLYALMCREQIDCAEFVPAVMRILVQYLDESGQRLDGMRLLICGSDTWSLAEYQQLKSLCGPHTRVINSFGLTEATIDSTYFECAAVQSATDQVVPIGRPFANTRLYILDLHLQPLPVGIPGELYVGGVGVARGYHNRADLTAEKFIANPFSEEPGERLYRTGDLARYLPDGNVEFLGRDDYQIKIRGFRIEPGEVEAMLGQHPALREIAVLACKSPTGDMRLVAYVVPSQGYAPTIGELRRFGQERLPDYMVPSAFLILDTMPLTPNGKIDRQALPAPDWSQRDLDGAYVAPRTQVEGVLATIWTQVLGVAQVGIYDDFFALGGHSLLATQLMSRIRDGLQVDLPLRTIFEASTVAELSEHVEIAQRTSAGLQATPIRPIDRDGELPLSFAQQRLWFLDQLEPDSPFYNIPETMRLRGPLDPTILERSLNEVVRRHEVLRTSFVTVDGQPVQVITPEMSLSLPVTDLRHLPDAEREAAAFDLANEEAQGPFTLARGPLFRVRLVQLAEDDHLILLIMHHIISDDWSTSILMSEITTLYNAFATGRPSPLPDLPIQYADFAAWQRHWLQGEMLETQLAYWKQQLAGIPQLLELPTDRPRPAIQSFEGSYQTFLLSRRLSYALKALSQREGVTLFMTLLAVFQVLLYRYTGQEDICIGTPIANRGRRKLEGLIGLFVNTLVLRSNLAGAPSFQDLLKQVREVTLGAYAHQDLPFEMLVEALQPERNLSHSPLFQVMVALQNAPVESEGVSDFSVDTVDAHIGAAKFDLTLFLNEEGDQISGALEYNTDLFDTVTITRMLGHFQQLLEGLVANPGQAITTLPLLTEAERQQLISEWNDTTTDYPADQCFHQLFEAQVERTPDAAAVTVGEQQVSYRNLNERVNQLAHFLQQQGVQPETLVGVCAERSIEMVIGVLGVLKAGGAYVPLDPTYPAERLAFMITDSQTPLLLTQQHLIDKLTTVISSTASDTSTPQPQVIALDTASALLDQFPTTSPTSAAGPENLAYIIYTSGSTGTPKGAMIVHRGLTNYLWWATRTYPVAQGQGNPVHSSISFDLTITSLLTPLITGRAAHLLPTGLGVETLSAAMHADSDYSLVKITPAHLELLSQQVAAQGAAGMTRAFVIGGENLLSEHIAFWQAHAPDTLLVNEYGPTETVVGCCVYHVARGEQFHGSVPIGRPIANTQLYVLDQHQQLLPVGVPGELYIGGAGVARGYLHRPELTAERFVPDPFRAEPDASLYRTGDLVRYRRDGNLEFLGRLDHQVKIRGFRIELGEIEAVVSEHASVRESVVLAREETPGHKRLVAYVVPASDALLSESAALITALDEMLKERLPDYMVPSAYVCLDALPLTANGKVDRKALPAPDGERPERMSDYVAPRTQAETILATIWAQLLGVEKVGIHDNFFELGGDSILTIQIISRANQAGLRLIPRHLFQAPTITQLAELAGAGPVILAEQGVVTGTVPLTPIQHWFFAQNQPASHHWNQSLLLETVERLQRPLFEQAVEHLLRHHDALRLRFIQQEDGWSQVHADVNGATSAVWVDLSALPVAEQSAAVEAAAAEMQAGLNLADGPVIKIAGFDLGAGRPGRLLIVIHHLVMDGVSWRILLEDVQMAYQQLSRGEMVQLPLKTTAYQAWAQRLSEYAQSETVEAELDYWLQRAANPTTHLPLDLPDGANTEASAHSVVVSLTAEETHALLHLVPSVYRTEINDVLLTALVQAFANWTGAHTLVVDVEGHGREDLFDDIDVSRTIGWFTSIVPVYLELDETEQPGAMLLAIKEQLRRIPNRGIGYGLLRYLNQNPAVNGPLRTLPQAEVSFNYLGQMDQVMQEAALFGLAPESSGPERNPHGWRTHLLDINGQIAVGQLQMEWTYSRNLHRQATIERVAHDFIETLQALIIHCESPEAESPTFTAEDFAEFGWSQEDLEGILSELEQFE